MGLIIIPNNSLPKEIEKIKKELHGNPLVRKKLSFVEKVRQDYEQRHETYKTFGRTTAMSEMGTLRHRAHIPSEIYWAMVRLYGTEYWDDERNWRHHPEVVLTKNTRGK